MRATGIFAFSAVNSTKLQLKASHYETEALSSIDARLQCVRAYKGFGAVLYYLYVRRSPHADVGLQNLSVGAFSAAPQKESR